MKKTICKYTIPDWLISLKPGLYSISQVQNLTKQSYDTIYQRFAALELKSRIYYKEIGENGRPLKCFFWPGLEEQTVIIVKKRLRDSKNKGG